MNWTNLVNTISGTLFDMVLAVVPVVGALLALMIVIRLLVRWLGSAQGSLVGAWEERSPEYWEAREDFVKTGNKESYERMKQEDGPL